MQIVSAKAILKGAFDDGREEKALNIARNMKLKGFSPDIIAELTQLPIDSIEKL